MPDGPSLWDSVRSPAIGELISFFLPLFTVSVLSEDKWQSIAHLVSLIFQNV